MKLKSLLFAASFAGALYPLSVMAQSAPPRPDMAIDKQVRSEVLDTFIKEMDERYVFPETAKKLQKVLRAQQKAGQFDAITSAQQLAEKLTETIRKETGDLHLRVGFSPDAIPVGTGLAEREGPKDGERDFLRRMNYGFQKVERLPGNIGYLELRGFAPARFSGQAIAAAMTLLNGTEGLIVDLRKNGGGDPETVALLASYFFEERTHLSDIIVREGSKESVVQMATSEFVTGPRYDKAKPVYILTSKRTFSAAEDFSYSLQTQKRAKVIGETTGGGAHPGSRQRLAAHFHAFIPYGRSFNPITKTDWEGVGVVPDVKVGADAALKTAQGLVLKTLADKEDDQQHKQDLLKLLGELNGEQPVAALVR